MMPAFLCLFSILIIQDIRKKVKCVSGFIIQNRHDKLSGLAILHFAAFRYNGPIRQAQGGTTDETDIETHRPVWRSTSTSKIDDRKAGRPFNLPAKIRCIARFPFGWNTLF